MLGLALATMGWFICRRVARTRWDWSLLLLLDALPAASLMLTIYAISGRPLFSGIVTLAIGAAYAHADASKRRVLAEPIVYTDFFQAPDIFRHPELALPFPNKGRILLGAIVGLTVLAGLYQIETPIAVPALHTLSALGLVLMCNWAIMLGPLNKHAGKWLRTLQLSDNPANDAARLGPFAALIGYGILARAERPYRRDHLPWRLAQLEASPADPTKLPNVLLVQCESFFDARRLHPTLQQFPLKTLDECREAAFQWGRLAVPTWGANTVRTEFAVMTGLCDDDLGMDRFNPYHRFARRPVSSLAWKLRTRGYRTVCIHPYDRRFYGRDEVLPNLGFDEFIGEEAFANAARVNGYIADEEVARVAQRALAESEKPVFLFVITMENHGPWTARNSGGRNWLSPISGIPNNELAGLNQYLNSLTNTDRMLAELFEICAEHDVFGFYGDHLPSFPAAFKALDLADTRSEYAVWSQATGPNRPARKDIHAHDLAKVILSALAPDHPSKSKPSRIEKGARLTEHRAI